MAGKIGIATGVFWNEYGEKTIEKLARIGYDAVDFSMFTDGHKRLEILDESAMQMEKYFRSLKNIMDDNGVSVVQTHASFPIDFDTNEQCDKIVGNFKKEIEASAILGAKYIVTHPSMKINGENNFAEGAYNFEKVINGIKDTATANNIEVCVENIPVFNKYKYCRVQGACSRAIDLDIYAEKFGVGVCLDTGHAHVVGENPAYVARKLGQKIKVMHLNDNYGIDDDHIMPYMGGINWHQLATALKEIEYKGDYCAEIYRLLERVKKTDCEFMFDVARTTYKLLKIFKGEVER